MHRPDCGCTRTFMATHSDDSSRFCECLSAHATTDGSKLPGHNELRISHECGVGRLRPRPPREIPGRGQDIIQARGRSFPMQERPRVTTVLVTAMAVAVAYLLAFAPSFVAPLMVRCESSRVASMRKLTASRLLARVALVTLGLAAATLLWLRWSDNRICVFHFSQDRSIVIRYNSFMSELEIPITYSAYERSKQVSPPFGCCATRIPFAETADNFRAYEFPNGKVVVQHRPNDRNYGWETIVVHDFRIGVRDGIRSNTEIDTSTGRLVATESLLR